MPIAFSKHDRCTIYLDADMERPETERVGFLCRFITVNESRQVAALHDELVTGKDMPAEQFDKKFAEALAIGVIGPVNAKHPRTGEPLPCTIAAIDEVLDWSEKWDLMRQYPFKLRPTKEEKKTSELPTPSSMEPTKCAMATSTDKNTENAGSAKTESTV